MNTPRSGNTEIELVKINSEETTPLLGHIRPMYIGAGTSIPKLVLCSLLFAALVVGGYLFFEEDRRWILGSSFDFISRDVWGANEDIDRGELLDKNFVTNVIVIHTNGPSCDTFAECARFMKYLQFEANRTTGQDIVHNFLIGSDAQTYEARGWSHASGFTRIPSQEFSMTIAFVGDYSRKPPSYEQIEQANALISNAVKYGRLNCNFSVFGIHSESESMLDAPALSKAVAARWQRNWVKVITVI